MRAFVAIDLPEPVKDALMDVQEALPAGRLAEPDQMHLTLAFLGERPDAEVEAAHQTLETVASPPFELRLAGLGTFGARAPSVLWAGVRDPAPLQALRSRVLAALHGAGLPLERRRFRPHVTLARFPPGEALDAARLARFLQAFEAFPSPPFEVRDFALWRSTLRRAGAIHDELARYPLRPVAG